MIEFSANGSRILVTVNAGYPIARSPIVATFETGSSWAAAELLAWKIREHFEDTVLNTKASAYDKGWTEGRSKKCAKRGRTAFTTEFGP